jgi:hypothetical protein
VKDPWVRRILGVVGFLGAIVAIAAASFWVLGGLPSWAMRGLVTENAKFSTCDSRVWTELAADECYAIVVANMVDRDGPKAIERIEQVANSNRAFQDICHMVMHDVASAYLTREVRKGVPIETLSDVDGGSICGAGYVHELMIVAAREATTPAAILEATSLCASEFGIVRYSCLHGLGHAVLDGSKRDVVQATTTCASDQLPSDVRVTCMQGAIHEYLLRIDIDEKFDVDEMCRSVPAAAAAWCYARGFDMTDIRPAAQPAAIFNACTTAPEALLQSCIAGASWSVRDRIPRKIDACLGLDEEYAEACFRGTTPSIRDATATRVGALYQRCAKASSSKVAADCVRLVADANAVLYDRPMASEACSSLDGSLRSTCESAVAESQGDAMLF